MATNRGLLDHQPIQQPMKTTGQTNPTLNTVQAEGAQTTQTPWKRPGDKTLLAVPKGSSGNIYDPGEMNPQPNPHDPSKPSYPGDGVGPIYYPPTQHPGYEPEAVPPFNPYPPGSGSNSSSSSGATNGLITSPQGPIDTKPEKPVADFTDPEHQQANTRTFEEAMAMYQQGFGYDPATMSVEGRMEGLLAAGNPYIEQNRQQAMVEAAGRGMRNSSIAAQAGQTAAIAASADIARSDAELAVRAREQAFGAAVQDQQTQQQHGFDLEKIGQEYENNKALAAQAFGFNQTLQSQQIESSEKIASAQISSNERISTAELLSREKLGGMEIASNERIQANQMALTREQNALQRNFQATMEQMNMAFQSGQNDIARQHEATLTRLQSEMRLNEQASGHLQQLERDSTNFAYTMEQTGVKFEMDKILEGMKMDQNSMTNFMNNVTNYSSAMLEVRAMAAQAGNPLSDADISKQNQEITNFAQMQASFFGFEFNSSATGGTPTQLPGMPPRPGGG